LEYGSVEPRLRSMRSARWDDTSKSSNLPEKKTLRATERDSERVQQLRVEYWHKIGAVNLEDLVFVDETGSNLRSSLDGRFRPENFAAMTRRYARSCRGSRAYNHAPYQRGQNVTPDWCNGTTGASWRDYFSRRNGCSSV